MAIPRDRRRDQANDLGTSVYLIGRTPWEIWQARGYAFNGHKRYEAASYKAQDRQDQMAVPIIGLAIATVATGIAHAGTAAVAATGLGGGAASGGYSYLHPDKDAATDQAASAALLCIVDRSRILLSMTATPLALDRAAIEDALQQLRTDAARHLVGVGANPAAKSAVESVETAAEATIKSLNAAIAEYVALPGAIFEEVDKADAAARTAGPRTLDYASLVKTFQTAASNQAATDKAKADVATATDKTAAAGGDKSKTGNPANTTNLMAAKTQLDAGAAVDTASLQTPPAAPSQNPPVPAGRRPSMPVTDTQAKATALHDTLTDPQLSDLARVNRLSKAALDDIPAPNFGAIMAEIKACNPAK